MLRKNKSFLEESTNAPKTLVAAYVDVQNVRFSPAQAEQFLLYANSHGCLTIKKAYANWRKENPAFEQNLYKQDLDCIHVPLNTKNAVDKKLIADCERDVSNNPSLKIVILVTGDGDFKNLVCSLQGKGKKVIIFAKRGNVNKRLEKLKTEFYFVDELPNLFRDKVLPQNTHVQPQPISYEDATKCLIEAIKTALQGKCTRFETIDRLMRSNKRFPNYCGVSCIRKSDGTKFGKFTKFIDAVAAEGKVKVQTVGQFKELFLIKKDRQVA